MTPEFRWVLEIVAGHAFEMAQLRKKPCPPVLTDRVTYILDACRGKRVLHLGCTDWPYTEKKLASGTLLHARIAAVAQSLVGVDADHDGVACFQRIGFPATYEDNVECFSAVPPLQSPRPCAQGRYGKGGGIIDKQRQFLQFTRCT